MDQEIALQRLNEEASELMEVFLFELNNDKTRSAAVKLLTEYLVTQVYEPVVVCNETNNTAEVLANHQLIVDYRFKFTESDEHFTDGKLTVPENAYVMEFGRAVG